MRARESRKTPGSGRKAGTPNKRTVALEERLGELGFDPLEFAVGVARGDLLFDTLVFQGKDAGTVVRALPAPSKVRVRAGLALMKYVYPRRKPGDAAGRGRAGC